MLDYVLMIVAIAAVSFYVGWKAREFYAIRQVFRMLKSEAENTSNEIPKTLLKLEKESDVIYAYDNESNEFLGQATSMEDLAQVLGQRFPNKRFAATPQNLKELGIHNESV